MDHLSNGWTLGKESLHRTWSLIDQVTSSIEQCDIVQSSYCHKRVNSKDIFSIVDIPGDPTSIYDGYACRVDDNRRRLRIVGECLAGKPSDSDSVSEGCCMYISTGGRIPVGADCVIPVECCDVSEGFVLCNSSGGDPGRWSGIRKVGSDTANGELILKRGSLINAGDVALLSACRIDELEVIRKLRVAVFSTGEEVFEGHIGDANRPYMIARLSELAEMVEITDLGIIKDDISAFSHILQSGTWDVIVSTGSVSKGKTDFIKSAMAESGFTIMVGQMDLKPGKPTTVSVNEHKTLAFGLPGNPASCFVTFNLLVYPTLMKLIGQVHSVRMHSTKVRLNICGGRVDPDPERPEFLRATVSIASNTGQLVATILEGHQRSSRIASCSGNVNCLVVVPPGADPVYSGSTGECYVIPGNVSVNLMNSHPPVESSFISKESKARAFDSLVEWLKVRTDVENIELMNLAGFCRNCLSKWLSEGSDGQIDSHSAKKYVYGMEYEEWKKRYRKNAIKSVNSTNPCAFSHQGLNHKQIPFKGFSLTVSDRASRGQYTDDSGPLIVEFLTKLGAESVESRIVPDEISEIQSCAKRWIENAFGHVSVLITTGGTGFADRDVTPEAISPLLTKPASGLVHLLLDSFVKENPLFALSRLVAGVSGKTFIVTLPGRPAAVEKALGCLSLVLPKLIQDLGEKT